MAIFTKLFRKKRKIAPKQEDYFFFDRPYTNPSVDNDFTSNLSHFLDFILTHANTGGNVNLYPSYLYTYHFIQALKEVNHPILNSVLNRSVHWFMSKKVPPGDISFTTYKILALFDFKHKIIQDYLTFILPRILKNNVNSREEIHLQAFDGYLTSPMKQEEDSAITGAHVLLKYHENLLIEDQYFDDNNSSRLLKLVENSLKRAGLQIWNRQVHRSYLYNLSSFLYANVLFREITESHILEDNINKTIIELNFYQNKPTGLWGDDIFQSAFIFNNLVSTRRLLRNDSRLEVIFKSFYDSFSKNYDYEELLKKNVTHSNFLMMSTLLQSMCKIVNNDSINEIVFRLREKKFEI